MPCTCIYTSCCRRPARACLFVPPTHLPPALVPPFPSPPSPPPQIHLSLVTPRPSLPLSAKTECNNENDNTNTQQTQTNETNKQTYPVHKTHTKLTQNTTKIKLNKTKQKHVNKQSKQAGPTFSSQAVGSLSSYSSPGVNTGSGVVGQGNGVGAAAAGGPSWLSSSVFRLLTSAVKTRNSSTTMLVPRVCEMALERLNALG